MLDVIAAQSAQAAGRTWIEDAADIASVVVGVGEVETFNVAMDRQDLAELKETVDRALTKAATLSDVVEGAGLALFELQEAER